MLRLSARGCHSRNPVFAALSRVDSRRRAADHSLRKTRIVARAERTRSLANDKRKSHDFRKVSEDAPSLPDPRGAAGAGRSLVPPHPPRHGLREPTHVRRAPRLQPGAHRAEHPGVAAGAARGRGRHRPLPSPGGSAQTHPAPHARGHRPRAAAGPPHGVGAHVRIREPARGHACGGAALRRPALRARLPARAGPHAHAAPALREIPDARAADRRAHRPGADGRPRGGHGEPSRG